MIIVVTHGFLFLVNWFFWDSRQLDIVKSLRMMWFRTGRYLRPSGSQPFAERP